MEKNKQTIQRELENNKKQLEVIKAHNNASEQVLRNYRDDFVAKLQQAIISDGILHKNIIDIRSYYGDGKSPQINITFFSPRQGYSGFEMSVTLRDRKVNDTRTSGISTSNNEDLNEVQNYYKMVSDIFSKINNIENFWAIMETWSLPEINWVSDYQLKDKINQLEKELKIAEMEIAEGSEIEYLHEGRFGQKWLTVKVKSISSKTICVGDEWNTYKVKKENIVYKLRKLSTEQ